MRIRLFCSILFPLCLVACSENRDTLLAKATTHLQNQRIDEAQNIYHRLYQQDPWNPEIIHGLMSTTRIKNATQDYLHWCHKMIQLRPWNREANITVAQDLAKQGKKKDAALRLLLAYEESFFKNDKKEVERLLLQISSSETQDDTINAPHHHPTHTPSSP